MIKKIALALMLALIPGAGFAQSSAPAKQDPAGGVSGTQNSPSQMPGMKPAPQSDMKQNPAGGTSGPSANPAAKPGNTLPAQPQPGGAPKPEGSGGSGSKN